MKISGEEKRACANEGCGRPILCGEVYCDACDLERLLYRRDLREPGTAPGLSAAGVRLTNGGRES